MKFTNFAVLALFLVSSEAVLLRKGTHGDNGKGLSYDLDVPTLNKAMADDVAKNQAFNGATAADLAAAATHAASTAAASSTAAADSGAGLAKSGTAATWAGTSYKSADKPGVEAAKDAAIKAKEGSIDSSLKAFDDDVAKSLIHARKDRDLAAATAAKNAADANLKSNQDRVAYEKDQLHRGENQDRLKHLDEMDKAKTSEIEGKHDERERSNGRLFKALAN